MIKENQYRNPDIKLGKRGKPFPIIKSNKRFIIVSYVEDLTAFSRPKIDYIILGGVCQEEKLSFLLG